MIKFTLALVASLALFAVVAFAASSPVAPTTAPTVATTAPTFAPEPPPVVLETSAVLVLAKPAPAKVARVTPKAPKAKAWTCGTWEASNVGGAFKRCEWR